MQVSIEFKNDTSSDEIIVARYSAKDVLRIFKATNDGVEYVCHALYSHAKCKLAKKKNLLNLEYPIDYTKYDVSEFENSKFHYFQLNFYEEYISLPAHETMSHQVMKWFYKENGITTSSVESHLRLVPEFNSLFIKHDQSDRDTRIAILQQMIDNGAEDLNLRISVI
jgi:hypothetical protein